MCEYDYANLENKIEEILNDLKKMKKIFSTNCKSCHKQLLFNDVFFCEFCEVVEKYCSDCLDKNMDYCSSCFNYKCKEKCLADCKCDFCDNRFVLCVNCCSNGAHGGRNDHYNLNCIFCTVCKKKECPSHRNKELDREFVIKIQDTKYRYMSHMYLNTCNLCKPEIMTKIDKLNETAN